MNLRKMLELMQKHSRDGPFDAARRFAPATARVEGGGGHEPLGASEHRAGGLLEPPRRHRASLRSRNSAGRGRRRACKRSTAQAPGGRRGTAVHDTAAAAAATSTGADRGQGRGRQPSGVRRTGRHNTAQAPGGRRGTAVHATAAAAAATTTGADRGHGCGRQSPVPGPHGLIEVETQPGSGPGSKLRYRLARGPGFQVRVPPGAGPGSQAEPRRSDGGEIAVQPPGVLQQRQLQPLRLEQIGAMGAVVSLLGRDGQACTALHGCLSTGADRRQLQPLRLERIATMGAVGDSQDGMALLGRLGCVGACADALMGAVSSLLESAGQGGMTLPRRLGCVGTHSEWILLRACLALSARRHPHGRGRQPPGVRQFTAELPPDHEDEKMLRVPGPHGLNEVEPPPGSEPGSKLRYRLPPGARVSGSRATGCRTWLAGEVQEVGRRGDRGPASRSACRSSCGCRHYG